MTSSRKRNWSIFFIAIILCFFFGNVVNIVNAQTNQVYGDGDVITFDDPGSSDDTGTVVGMISIAFLQVGRMAQTLIAWLMGLLMGNVDGAAFPWADKTIFNCVPLLDVNFINPANGSLLRDSSGADTDIGNAIRNTYFTGISVAVGFLSIMVGIMAIRMALSTIAATKAKYKESIVNLLTTLVLIFGLHIILSGLFFVNEKMVEVASKIVHDAFQDEDLSSIGEQFYSMALDQGGSTSVLWINIQKAAPIPTILYLIFIYQSLVFLVAYFKRFFYVTILAIIGPFVVIFDFLKKILA